MQEVAERKPRKRIRKKKVHDWIKEPFWLVWGGKDGPTVKQPTFAAALHEAARLSALVPDQTFYIVEKIGAFRNGKPVENPQ